MPNYLENHPNSLKVFFATEMWERYGFYVVQSLLALYLANHFNWPDDDIFALVGSFTALTYLSPVLGGWIADKLLGQKRSVLLGAILLFISYCTLAFFESHAFLLGSLAGVAVGTGLLKPNISALLGNEYPDNSEKRESGFTIFYMGITTGIILGTTLPNFITKYLGWPGSFASAAFGMVIAFMVFRLGVSVYKIKDYVEKPLSSINIIIALVLLFLLWKLCFYILSNPDDAYIFFAVVILISALFILYAVSQESPDQAIRTVVIALLCIISVTFWAFYFQMFLSLTLFISRLVEPSLYGIDFPAPYYVTIESFGMLFIGYYLAKKPSSPSLIENGLGAGKKFVTAMLLISLAYAWIELLNIFSNPSTLISPLFIIPSYLLISLAELLLCPVGIAAITFLAHKNRVSTMMGILFVSLGIGGFLSGKLAALTAIPYGETNLIVLHAIYTAAFQQQLIIIFCGLIVSWMIYLIIKYLLTKIGVTEIDIK